MKRSVLYESEFARVVAVGDALDKVVCVTFYTFATDEGSLNSAVGFGEALLRNHGISAVHFINLKNHWWQIPDLDRCLAAATDWLKGSIKRVGYGASMGGYAALNFSEALDLDTVLAFSPQYSIDSSKVPWEKRWLCEAEKLTFDNDAMRIRTNCQAHIFYDPGIKDGLHAQLIAQENKVGLYEIPSVGHFAIKAFHDAGLLKPLLFSALEGEMDKTVIASLLEHLIASKSGSA